MGDLIPKSLVTKVTFHYKKLKNNYLSKANLINSPSLSYSKTAKKRDFGIKYLPAYVDAVCRKV